MCCPGNDSHRIPLTRCLSTSRGIRAESYVAGVSVVPMEKTAPRPFLGKNPGTCLTDLQKPWRRICARAKLAVGGELQLILSGRGLDVLAET